MVVFDLSQDRMAVVPFQVVADVQAAVIFEEDRYWQASRKIGLTRGEFEEFERRVIDGDVKLTMLPSQLDAMAGQHHGRIYAVRNAHVRGGERSFVVALADGKRVYVPMKCGNVSVVRNARPQVVARTPRTPVHTLTRAVRRPAAPVVAAVAAPLPAPPAPVAPAVAVAAPVVPVAAVAHHNFALPFLMWVAGTIDHTVTGGTPPGAPACTASVTSDSGFCLTK